MNTVPTTSTLRRSLGLVTLLAAALALGACSREERSAAEDKLDRGLASVEQKADAVQADAARAYERAKERGGEALAKVGDKVSDAAITTAVHAELAKDGDLSSLAIDVDTADGRVLLKGNAPSEEARERASRLVANIDGVRSVDNNLVVKGAM